MKILKVVAIGASVLGASAVLSAVAIAGGSGGCIHGADYSNALLENNDAAQTPVVASEIDPKWLALQKRLALQDQTKVEVIQVPN